MSNRKRLALEIGLLFLTAVFSNWLVSLGDDGPSFFVEHPVRFFGSAILLSVIGGYGLHRFKLRQEAKAGGKTEKQ